MPDISNVQISRMSKGISIARGVFADAYNDFASDFGTPLFIQIAEERNQAEPLPVGAERDQKDYAAALRVARDEGWLVKFVFEKFDDLAGAATDETRLELQSIVVFTERFADAKQVESGTLAASRRCCQIRTPVKNDNGELVMTSVGSGFLIGPHLVLTNYHVIQPLLDPAGRAPDPELPNPEVVFDHYKGQRRDAAPETLTCPDNWLLTFSPAAPVTAQAQDLKGNLDFAVIRLNGLPGYARGWYDLAKAPDPPAVGNMLEIWQFPQKGPMMVVGGPRNAAVPGFGFEALPATEVPPRLFYMINALKGSSGSLVLDADKRPIGLHDAGFEGNTPQAARPNRGVPLCLVRDAAGSNITQELLNLPQKIGWHPARKLPILGRSELQSLIFKAQRGDVRIISILTSPDPASNERLPKLGRSYTHTILEACLPDTDHHILEFSAAQIDPDPFLTARRIVASVSPARVADLPEPSGETTLDADATGMLLDATVATLLSAAAGKTIWLMIDDIDAHPIGTQWGSSSFLIALYRRAAVQPKLRIVLVGLPRQLEGVRDLEESMVLQAEHLDHTPDDNELNFWIQAHLANGNWPADLAPKLTRMIRSVANEQIKNEGDSEVCLTEATAGVLAAHARKAFRAEGSNDEQ